MTQLLIDNKWEVIIGLEVHAQINTASKLFSASPTNFGAETNMQVSFIDAAMPGMLPVANHECIMKAIKTGIALNATINNRSIFARKNYFYADLPQGYQISQYEAPIVGEGHVTINLDDGTEKIIGIERLHIEQDAGKSIHDQSPIHSYIDLNRSGIALMEIVSKPDMRCADDAVAYINKLRSILEYIDTCDCNMAEGSLRVDVNVSVHLPNTPFGTRTELKNINSVRFVRQAIDYEVRRQITLLESGGEVIQETRLFDTSKGETRAMRSKEDAHDYRYFPDPDLPELIIEQNIIDTIRANMPELPDAKLSRFQHDYGLSAYDAAQLVADQATATYFEDVVVETNSHHYAKQAANWILSELFARMKKMDISHISNIKVTATQLAALINFVEDGTISGKIAKNIFDEMMDSGKKCADIIKDSGLQQISDTSAISDIIQQIITDNPKQTENYRQGNDKLFGWFVGQVMKATQGQANPKIVNDLLKQYL